jgi:hypothetical protein
MYTRIDDLSDVIMREKENRFEVETRSRKDTSSQFSSTFYKSFEKTEEIEAEKMYEGFVVSATTYDD